MRHCGSAPVAGSGLLISMLKKLNWFDQSDNAGAIDVKMDGPVLEEKSFLKCWVWLSLLNWNFDSFYEVSFS